MRISPALFVAGSAVVLLSVMVITLSFSRKNASSRLSINLVHGDISILASSFAPHEPLLTDTHDSELKEIQALAASIRDEDVRLLSDSIFQKSKFSLLGSHNNGSSASFSTRKLRSKPGDKQFFVQFSTPADIYTLAALAKFTGQDVVSHVHDNLFVAIGSDSFPARARRFPGVVWVQERFGSDKIGGSLRLRLDLFSRESIFTKLRRRVNPTSDQSESNPIVNLIVQCLHDSCGVAAQHVRALCPDVYVHAELIEVICAADVVERAVSLLGNLVGVEHIDIKQRVETKNFAGSAILGTGPLATSISQSKVLTSIDVSSSVIGVADTGINMNNCYFYDSTKTTAPWSSSRVLASYNFLPCASCGRCCTSGSTIPNCNELNACGNYLDQDGHGTHVSGTVAGSVASSPVSLGNGISAGAKLYFQDIENRQPSDKCFRSGTGACDGLYPGTQLSSLFQPAYNAGV
jgi:hypothetical protein